MDTHTAVAVEPKHEPEPLLNIQQRWLLGVAAPPTVTAGFWAAVDLRAIGHFSSPDLWWLLVLAALGGWIAFAVESSMKKSRRNQALMMDEVHLVRQDVDALTEAVRTYGDLREIDGHASAARASMRHLHTVE